MTLNTVYHPPKLEYETLSVDEVLTVISVFLLQSLMWIMHVVKLKLHTRDPLVIFGEILRIQQHFALMHITRLVFRQISFTQLNAKSPDYKTKSLFSECLSNTTLSPKNYIYTANMLWIKHYRPQITLIKIMMKHLLVCLVNCKMLMLHKNVHWECILFVSCQNIRTVINWHLLVATKEWLDFFMTKFRHL